MSMSYDPYFDVYSFVMPAVMISIFLFIVGVIVLALRLIFGSRQPTTNKVESAKRGYYYLMSLITLYVLYFAGSDLLNLVLSAVFNVNPVNFSQDSFARGIALRAATLIVTLPVYVFHWTGALRTPETDDEAVIEYVKRERKGYAQIIMVFSTIFLLIFGIRFVYLLLLFGLLGERGASASQFIWPFSYTVGIVAIWAYHVLLLKDAKKK